MQSVNLKLYELAVFFLPFLSLPVLPSVYRPISILFLCIPALFFVMNTLKNRKFNHIDSLVIGLFFFIIMHSVAFLFFSEISISHYLKEVMVLCLGLVAYFGFRYSFEQYGYFTFLKFSLLSYRVILTIGLIEVGAIYGLLPYELKHYLNEFISTKSNTRIQLATMEASWAARTLMFFIPVMLYLRSSQILSIHIIEILIGLILFFLIFSIDGYLILALSFFLYLISTGQWKKTLLLFVICIPLFLVFLQIANLSGGYYFSRIQNIASGEYYEFTDLLYIDQSVFIRAGYMLNAIIISFEQALGTGLGQYSLYFNESLFSHFGTTVLQFPEVADDILSASGDPRSLYLKASAESSFLALLLLLLLIFRCWQKAIKIRDTNTRFFMIVYLTLMSVSLISFESWAYLYLWLTIAIIASYQEKES